MNIANSEVEYDLIAKTCGCKDKKRKVTYSFVFSAHSLCKDKKDLILSQIEACERLSKYTKDETDLIILKNEITQLKLTLDLLH
jgi:hypothetical protein